MSRKNMCAGLVCVFSLGCVVGCGDDGKGSDAPLDTDASTSKGGTAADDAGPSDTAGKTGNTAGMTSNGEQDASSADFDGGLIEPIEFSPIEVELYSRLAPLPELVPDPTNAKADNAAAAVLGQKLFFDRRYSGPLKVDSDLGDVGETGKVSCASCHDSALMSDARSMPSNVSLGADFHSRNAPAVVNSSFYTWTNWGGRFSAQWELPLAVAEAGVILNSSRLQIAHLIFDNYKDEYEAIFGALEPAIGSDADRFPAAGKPKPAPTTENPDPPDGAWEGMTAEDRAVVNQIFVNYGKLLQAYFRKLVSRDAPFDDFVAGDDDAIDASAKRGLKLFIGPAGCNTCHRGPFFTDQSFHNLGVPQSGEHVPASDDGRFKDIPGLLSSSFNSAGSYSDDPDTGRLLGLTNPAPEAVRGAFRTPTLRGVSQTGPYMHSGQFATLEEVIEFYDAGGGVPVSGTRDEALVPLHLSARDKADLVAFLETLDGAPVPASLMQDTSGQ